MSERQVIKIKWFDDKDGLSYYTDDNGNLYKFIEHVPYCCGSIDYENFIYDTDERQITLDDFIMFEKALNVSTYASIVIEGNVNEPGPVGPLGISHDKYMLYLAVFDMIHYFKIDRDWAIESYITQELDCKPDNVELKEFEKFEKYTLSTVGEKGAE